MNKIESAKIRNFSITGHPGSGKTSLADLMLYKSGKVTRLGKVQDKTSISDYRPEEQERQHSVYATPLFCEWNDHRLFFIDTPGYADFFGDTVASISISDTNLIVINANEGIEVGTTRAWKVAQNRGIPRAFFINCLDHENAHFDKALESIQQAYGVTTCVPFTLPIGKESDLKEIVHVLRSQNFPEEVKETAEKYKSTLMDTVAESDEELMLRYLDGEELTEAEISTGLHAAIADGSLIPVFCGSVTMDIGVNELMNGIVNLFNSPLTAQKVPLINGELDLQEDGDGMAFAFKTIIDPFTGHLSIFRVYSGTISSDSEVTNLNQRHKERLGHLLFLSGREQEHVSEAGPGTLFAVAKLKNIKVNDTLSTSSTNTPFPPIQFPKPKMSYACYPLSRGDEDKIANGLHRLSEEDPTILVHREPETRELLLAGLGDKHLTSIITRLKSDFKVKVDLRTPKIPYRETITRVGDAKYRHKKQSGGHGQFAEVLLRIEPLPDADFEFVSEVVGGNIPKNFIPSVEKGVVDAMTKGPLAHSRVINIRAVVYDGKHHPVDSSDMAFQIAGRFAFREAMKLAKPILLEPVMNMKISVPDEFMGDISADLNQRRGRILGVEVEAGMEVVNAEIPLAETHTYPSQLRSLTRNRGSFEMEFARYEQVPANISKEIQETVLKEETEEK